MAVDALARARELVRGAKADKRESMALRKRARARFREAQAFCEAVGLDFEEIRTEAKGHGPREDKAP